MKKLLSAFGVPCIILSACGQRVEETRPVRKDVEETVFASGIIEPENAYYLTALTDGVISELSVREGDLLNEGQVVGRVDNLQNRSNLEEARELWKLSRQNLEEQSPVLEKARNSIADARVRYEKDSTNFVRYQRLLQTSSVSKSEYESVRQQAENARIGYQNAVLSYKTEKQRLQEENIRSGNQKNIYTDLTTANRLTAPAKGKVYKLLKQRGDFVRRGDAIALIGDPDALYAKVSVDENNIGKIRVGQPSLIQLNATPDKVYNGKVRAILPQFDDETQSFYCEINFSEPLEFTVIGTQLQANIVTNKYKDALVIPRSFLDFGGQVSVKGKKAPVKVKTGVISNEWVMVVSGIDESTTIVRTVGAGTSGGTIK